MSVGPASMSAHDDGLPGANHSWHERGRLVLGVQAGLLLLTNQSSITPALRGALASDVVEVVGSI
jgi:hypothetical protein